MSRLIFFYGDTLGMQKDRLSSTHGERLSLHIITLPSHSEGEKERKKKRTRNTHSINCWKQLDNPESLNHSHHPNKNVLQTSTAATTSCRSIPGIMLTTETGQIIRSLGCMELCNTVATLLYRIWVNEQNPEFACRKVFQIKQLRLCLL